MDHQRVVFLDDDDAGYVVLTAITLHLSRVRGRSDRILGCDPGGGNSLRTGNVTRGDTPTPALPRKRERERTVSVARVSPLAAARLHEPPLDAVDGQAWQPETEDPPLR